MIMETLTETENEVQTTLLENLACEDLTNAMCCAIWYYLRNFKNVKNTRRSVTFSKVAGIKACNFTKNNTPPWVFFPYF